MARSFPLNAEEQNEFGNARNGEIHSDISRFCLKHDQLLVPVFVIN